MDMTSIGQNIKKKRETSFEIRETQYTEKIQKLPKEEQDKVYKVLDIMLEHD